MSLQPDSLTALALWLCVGRFFDYDCCPNDNDTTSDILKSARGIVCGGALRVATEVSSWHSAARFLDNQADGISALRQYANDDYAVEVLNKAEIFIRETAQEMENENSYRWGLLDLVRIIELRIRKIYEENGGISRDVETTVNYTTEFTDDSSDFAPFCIDG